METCNKIPRAQHGRRGKRLKLNTTTLRGAAQAHTDRRRSRADEPGGGGVGVGWGGGGCGLAGQLRFKGRCRSRTASIRASKKAWTDISQTLEIPISVFVANLKFWWSHKKQAVKEQWWW